jgi:two-component sensor histidine kinase
MGAMKVNGVHRGAAVLLWIMVLISIHGYGQKTTEDWLQLLESTIAQASNYDDEKLTRIDEFYQQFQSKNENKVEKFERCLKLFEEYSIFNFDSAHSFASRLQKVAFELNDPSRIAYSKLKLSSTLLSSGMYKEVFDTLRTINLRYLDARQKAEYYILMARSHFDLADYNQSEFYSPKNVSTAKRYLDSALALDPENSFDYQYYSGLKFIREGDDASAAKFFDRLVQSNSLSAHERALVTSTYADIFMRKENFDKVIELLCEAAISDIQSSTKETAASYYLAILLFKRGDLKRASIIIQKASLDAQFYGARQRTIQVNSQVPLIVEKLDTVERERRSIFLYAMIITSIFLILFILVIVIVKQVRKLRSQQSIIHQKNHSLQNLLLEKDTLLEEKEWLRKEIHHRVKNNMQTVVSLLESQSAFLKDGALMATWIWPCMYRS